MKVKIRPRQGTKERVLDTMETSTVVLCKKNKKMNMKLLLYQVAFCYLIAKAEGAGYWLNNT